MFSDVKNVQVISAFKPIRLSQRPTDSTRHPSITTAVEEDYDRMFLPVSDGQSRASSTSMLATNKMEEETSSDRFDFEVGTIVIDQFCSLRFLLLTMLQLLKNIPDSNLNLLHHDTFRDKTPSIPLNSWD